MSVQGTSGTGVCFHRSAALVLDLPGSELCIGTFRGATDEELKLNPKASTEPFLHAWVEHNGLVYAPTTIEANNNTLRPYTKAEYYEVHDAKDIHRLSRRDLISLSGKIGLSQHLLHGKPTKNDASVGGSILDAAGVEWKDSATGGVIPA
jgi:hypothetical protein